MDYLLPDNETICKMNTAYAALRGRCGPLCASALSRCDLFEAQDYQSVARAKYYPVDESALYGDVSDNPAEARNEASAQNGDSQEKSEIGNCRKLPEKTVLQTSTYAAKPVASCGDFGFNLRKDASLKRQSKQTVEIPVAQPKTRKNVTSPVTNPNSAIKSPASSRKNEYPTLKQPVFSPEPTAERPSSPDGTIGSPDEVRTAPAPENGGNQRRSGPSPTGSERIIPPTGSESIIPPTDSERIIPPTGAEHIISPTGSERIIPPTGDLIIPPSTGRENDNSSTKPPSDPTVPKFDPQTDGDRPLVPPTDGENRIISDPPARIPDSGDPLQNNALNAQKCRKTCVAPLLLLLYFAACLGYNSGYGTEVYDADGGLGGVQSGQGTFRNLNRIV